MRIAMTGATGFVGRWTLARLLEAGHMVTALARNPQNVQSHQACAVIKGDLHDAQALHQLTSRADVVLHIAGAVSAPTRAAFFKTNVEGTKAIAEAAKASGVKRFVFVSSLAAREPDLNDYSASKAAAEDSLRGFAQDFDITILRPSAVYGAGDTATLPLLKALLSPLAILPGHPNLRFSMVHVDDVAQVLVEAINGPIGTFELDDGEGWHNWSKLIALTQKHFGTPKSYFYIPRPIALAIGEAGSVWGRFRNKPALVNAGQMRQLYHPDWVARGKPWPLKQRIPLGEGLPETIRWYQENGQLPRRGPAVTTPANGRTS
jgi:nucleoside-diphosphate-sugar epimerase